MSPGPIECLQELRTALERGEAPSGTVCERVIAAIIRIERVGGLTLDSALGLSPRLWNQYHRRLRAPPVSRRRGFVRPAAYRAQGAPSRAADGAGGELQYSDHQRGRGPEFFKVACERGGFEGTVSKRADAPHVTDDPGLGKKQSASRRTSSL